MVKPIYQSDKIYRLLFIADVHRTQQTDCGKVTLTKKTISLCNVPPGCTTVIYVGRKAFQR